MSSTTSVHSGSATTGPLPLFPAPESAVSSSVHSYHAFNSSVSYPCSTIRLPTVLTINGIAKHFASIKLDLEGLPSGNYILQAEDDLGERSSTTITLTK